MSPSRDRLTKFIVVKHLLLNIVQRCFCFREEPFSEEDACLLAVCESYWFWFLIGFQGWDLAQLSGLQWLQVLSHFADAHTFEGLLDVSYRCIALRQLRHLASAITFCIRRKAALNSPYAIWGRVASLQ